jgi:hypothetical protein
MRLGLGLGIGGAGRGASKPSAAEKTIKAAIKERHHIRAVRDGVKVLIQPYALLKVGGASILHGVVVVVEGDAVGGWSIAEIGVPSLSAVEIYNATFIPADIFSADGLDGVVAVVEPVDPFKDAAQDGADAAKATAGGRLSIALRPAAASH